VIALFVIAFAIVLWLCRDLLKAIVTGEIRGAIADRCRRKIDEAAELLPPEIADDIAYEWRAELAAFEGGNRLLSAWRFARALPTAARGMRAESGPALATPSQTASIGAAARRAVHAPPRWVSQRAAKHDSLEAFVFAVARQTMAVCAPVGLSLSVALWIVSGEKRVGSVAFFVVGGVWAEALRRWRSR
jgi:hypothetical protein